MTTKVAAVCIGELPRRNQTAIKLLSVGFSWRQSRDQFNLTVVRYDRLTTQSAAHYARYNFLARVYAAHDNQTLNSPITNLLLASIPETELLNIFFSCAKENS